MNSIELTEEHRKQLLEMCKALFPDNWKDCDSEYEDTFFDEEDVLEFPN